MVKNSLSINFLFFSCLDFKIVYYKTKQDVCIFMLSIARQTDGPIRLKFFVELMGGRWCYRLKKLDIFSTFKKKFTDNAGPFLGFSYFYINSYSKLFIFIMKALI